MRASIYLNQIKKHHSCLYRDDLVCRARCLVGIATDLSPIEISPSTHLNPHQVSRLFVLLRRHLRGESLQHLQNQCEVLEFKGILPATALAPREETMYLMDLLAKKCVARWKENKCEMRNIRVLELGCASALLLCSFVLRLEKYGYEGSVEIFGSDLVESFLDSAFKNCKQLQLQLKHSKVVVEHVEFRHGSWWDPWLSDSGSLVNIAEKMSSNHSNWTSGFDVIFSNPPYIAMDDAMRVDTAVWLSESHLALFAEGYMGLACYNAILSNVKNALSPSGFLALETGDRQVYDVLNLAKTFLGVTGDVVSDMEGVERFFIIARQ